MKTCEYCGKLLVDNATKCPICGRNQDEGISYVDSKELVAHPYYKSNVRSEDSLQRQGMARATAIIAIVAELIVSGLFGFILAIVALAYCDDSNYSTETSRLAKIGIGIGIARFVLIVLIIIGMVIG